MSLTNVPASSCKNRWALVNLEVALVHGCVSVVALEDLLIDLWLLRFGMMTDFVKLDLKLGIVKLEITIFHREGIMSLSNTAISCLRLRKKICLHGRSIFAELRQVHFGLDSRSDTMYVLLVENTLNCDSDLSNL